jgi:hypothetical protein
MRKMYLRYRVREAMGIVQDVSRAWPASGGKVFSDWLSFDRQHARLLVALAVDGATCD